MAEPIRSQESRLTRLDILPLKCSQLQTRRPPFRPRVRADHVLEPLQDELEAAELCVNLSRRVRREEGLVFWDGAHRP